MRRTLAQEKAEAAGASEVWWVGGEGNRFGYWQCKTEHGPYTFNLPEDSTVRDDWLT